MRRSLVALILGTALVGAVVLSSCGGDDGDEGTLGSRTTNVGDVEIQVALRRLDDIAEFKVALDTHEGSLDADLTTSRLSVAGTDWGEATWDGDGPGGHHREGVLRFRSTGVPTGAVQLSLEGFDDPVVLEWTR